MLAGAIVQDHVPSYTSALVAALLRRAERVCWTHVQTNRHRRRIIHASLRPEATWRSRQKSVPIRSERFGASMASDVLGTVVVRSPLRVRVDSLAALQPCIRHDSMPSTPSVLPPLVVRTRAC